MIVETPLATQRLLLDADAVNSLRVPMRAGFQIPTLPDS